MRLVVFSCEFSTKLNFWSIFLQIFIQNRMTFNIFCYLCIQVYLKRYSDVSEQQYMATQQERAELHKTIWKIANDLRGAVDGWEFKATL